MNRMAISLFLNVNFILLNKNAIIFFEKMHTSDLSTKRRFLKICFKLKFD